MRSKIAARWIDRGDECGGWDGSVANYELVLPLADAELAEANAAVDAMLTPPTERMVLAELSRLRALTVSRDVGDDLALIFAGYVDELARYPAEAVRSVLRQWPRSNKFWPALAELVGDLDRLVAPRLALREALRRGYREPEPQSEWTRPTPEDVARVEQLLVDHGLSRATARAATGRPVELVPITAADREVMAAELAQWRERWASVTARDAAAA